MYVQYYFDGYSKHFQIKQYTRERFLRSLWINYQGPNEYQPPHVHDNAYLSFVIYCDIPEELKKEHDDFVANKDNEHKVPPGTINFEYGENMPMNLICQRFMPYNNQIFIFPAWVKHYVIPFKSDVKRISISGNITFDRDPEEIQNNKIAHRKDGLAIINFLYWFEKNKRKKLSEIDIIESIANFRKNTKKRYMERR